MERPSGVQGCGPEQRRQCLPSLVAVIMSPEAAPAIAKYDDDQKRFEDEKKKAAAIEAWPVPRTCDIRLTRAP